MTPKRIPAPDVDPSPLGQPLRFEFGGRTAPNRFLKGAMTERLSSWDPKELQNRGIPSDDLINLYQRWGEGGLGLILTGNTMLYYDQLEAPGNPVIPKDALFSGERFERFKTLGAKAKAHGSLIVAQLSHPGRQAPDIIQPNPLSASDVQLEGTALGWTFGKPRAMDFNEIKEVIGSFVHAAEYLHKAGYDGVQLHGAHGYLIAQFLSQTTNKRADEYGGSLLNRARLIFEIVDGIRRRVNDESFLIGIKLNSVEFQHGGFTSRECRDLCVELEKHNVDFVELSGGTYQQFRFSHTRESTRKREAFFIEFAEMITVDGIGLARPVTHEPDFAKKIINGDVKSAIDYGVDEQQDFGLSFIAAGAQIRLMGKGKEPLDLGRPENKATFDRALQQFQKDMANNVDGSKYGILSEDFLPNITPVACLTMALHNPNNWHWVSKNTSAWAQDWFQVNLPQLSAQDGEVTAKISKVLSMDGDVDVSQRKGKVITIFDVKLVLEYSGSAPDADDVSGTITIPEVAHDTDEDEFVFDIDIHAESKEKQPVKDLIRSKLVPQLRKELLKLGPEMIAEHGKDIQHAAGSNPSSGFSTPKFHVPTGAATKSDTAPSTQKNAGSIVNTTTLSEQEEFRTTAAELYQTFTDPQRLAAFTRAAPKRFDGAKVGASWELFDGNVAGEYRELQEPTKIVQTWRLKQWPAGHYSQQTLNFDQNDVDGVTVMRVEWSGVPIGQEEVTKRNWDEYYVRSIKKTFGFGTIL
ncbi:hypothetical protein GQX73_g937 [Xylaria multiplex]|uniref:Activator of Hsp90 ATPase AHSA1-like N-terminal domain-containing protein n=1 Tax=Xylaria multiplex TaxID=323545 RepID=A0A7C8MVW0_9PEZI|nr:hypothetical protein GQX73_g937 [Xylaria multiplex]